MSIDTQTSPLVIIAFDAGDPDFIQQWVQQGYLPTLGSLMQRGCWGRFAGREQLSEWGTWTSLFSGISRGQHGFYYFRQLVPGTYNLGLFSVRDTGVLPFWSHLRGREKKVAIIDAPDSVIVDGLRGIQLADWATRYLPQREVAAVAQPPEILQEARRVFGPQLRVVDFSPKKSFAEDREVYHRLLARVEKKGALCRHLLAKDHFDLVVIGFHEAHDAAHRFWEYRPEARDGGNGHEANELTDAIRDVYQAIDRQLGLLLAQLPDAANVALLSCYGMADLFPTDGLIEAFCRTLGYQALPETTGLSHSPLTLLRQALPQSWRVALAQHLPTQVQERLLADRFRNGTDWRRTSAFAIPALFTSFVRVNLRGREPLGTVEPGERYETLLDRLEQDLRQLVDPQTGGPAVRQVMRTNKLFGHTSSERLPDLFVGWQPSSHFMQRVIHPQVELVQQKPGYFRGSYHSREGFLVAAGPSIQARGATGPLSVLDLAPTFLSLLGESVPQTLTGQVVEGMVQG